MRQARKRYREGKSLKRERQANSYKWWLREKNVEEKINIKKRKRYKRKGKKMKCRGKTGYNDTCWNRMVKKNK